MISRNAWLYIAALAFVWFNFQVIALILNLYLRDLGYSESHIGWVNSSLAAGFAFMVLPSAVVLSRVRLKPLMQTSIVLFSVFSIAMVSVQPFWAIIGLAVLAGTMLAAVRVTVGPFFMSNSTGKERATLFSFSSAADVLAGVIAFAGAGKLAAVIQTWLNDSITAYRYTLYVGAAVSLLALIPIRMLDKPMASTVAGNGLRWQRMTDRWRLYLRIWIAGTCVGLSAGVVVPFLNLFLSDRFGLSSDAIGMLLAIATAATFMGAMMGPVFVRSLGLVRTLVVIHAVSLPMIATTAYSGMLVVVSAAIVLRSALMGMSFPLVTNFFLEICRPEQRGIVNAVGLFSINSSWMASMAIGGYLIEGPGYTTAFNAMLVLYVVTALVFLTFFGSTKKMNEASSEVQIG
jgi:MFS family permease